MPRATRRENIFVGLGEADVRRSAFSPSAGNGQEQFGLFSDELGLLLRREHQVSVALLHSGKRREDAAAYAEIDRAEVRAFLGPFEAERDAAEILDCHLGSLRAYRRTMSEIEGPTTTM